MMNKIIRTTLIALLLTFAAHAAAQQGLQIATVFQKYGKQKGVTMVELSNEMLETYQMTLYKSLVFKDASDALPTILRCLEADKKKAKKVKEVVSNGQIKSGYYQLPQLKGGCKPLYPLQNRKERFGYPYLYRRRTGCRRPDHHVIHEERIKNR